MRFHGNIPSGWQKEYIKNRWTGNLALSGVKRIKVHIITPCNLVIV